MAARRTVLFVCVGNAGRSVMAEAIFNSRSPNGWRATSAGVSPARATNPNTGAALSEIGVQVPAHPPQGLTEPMVAAAAICISIGAIDHPSCPEWFLRARPVLWTLPDTHGAEAQAFREIREAVRAKIEALIEELGRDPPANRSKGS